MWNNHGICKTIRICKTSSIVTDVSSFFFSHINFKLARRECFILSLLENYGSYEILSRYLIFILYGIGTFYSHLPTLIRIEWIGTLRLAAETFLTGRDFCQRNHSTVARIHVRWNALETHRLQRHAIST